MPAEQVFKVLTEFRFEAGSAIATSNQLKGAVQGVSDAADSAIFSLQRMALGFGTYLGAGSGGVLGLLYSAITASDKFYQSQIKLSNVFQSAGFFKGPQAFENAMLNSEAVLERIRKTSSKFSLPAGDMLATTSLLAPALMAKGLDDSNLTRSTDLSRQFLKASPILGTDPSMAMGQLLGAISGRTDMGGQFTQRLFADTKALKAYSGQGGTQKFNALSDTKRLDLLTKALGEFANNTRAAEAIAKSFSGQMQLMRDQLFGVFSILKPLGDALVTPIVKMMQGINEYLKSSAPTVIKNFADILAPMVANPEKLLVGLMQGSALKNDVRSAGRSLAVGGIVSGLGEAIKFLGGSAKFANPLIAWTAMGIDLMAQSFGKAFPILAPFMKHLATFTTILSVILAGLAYFGKLGAAFGLLVRVLPLLLNLVSRLFWPLAIMVGLFQVVSRAIAEAKVQDAKNLVALMPEISESMARLNRAFTLIMAPVMQFVDWLAKAISPLFQMTFWLKLGIGVIDGITAAIALVVGGFQGLVFVILHLSEKMNELFGGGKSTFGSVEEAFTAGTDDIFEKIYGKIAPKDGELATGKMTTNIGKIEIRNDFKDNLEPDRVAFTIKEQIMKTAINPTGASRRSLKGALVGG